MRKQRRLQLETSQGPFRARKAQREFGSVEGELGGGIKGHGQVGAAEVGKGGAERECAALEQIVGRPVKRRAGRRRGRSVGSHAPSLAPAGRFARQTRAVRPEPLQRIDVMAAHDHFPMQMRAGRQAGQSDHAQLAASARSSPTSTLV